MAGAVTSAAGVCNLALGLVGQKQFLLDSLEERSEQARVSKAYYASTRDELLALYPWRFATKRAVLALTDEERSGWAFAYASPADLLVARYIWAGRNRPGQGQQIPFAKELNDAATGQLILTNMEQAELVYTVQLTTVALFTPSFVAALAAQLAVYFAGAIPVKPALLPSLQQAAQLRLQMAIAVDANEAVLEEEPESETIRIRG